MDLVKVKSSNLSEIGYDEQSRLLRIVFQTGAVYDYMAVPAELYNELLRAKSAGTFFQQHVNGKFQFEKVNPEKERNVMGQNKAQKQAAARAQAAAPNAAQPAEQPKAAAPKPPAAQPLPTPSSSKQSETINKLKAAWVEKKVDLSKLVVKDDGKFKLIVVDAGWPTVQIGPTGGIVVLELRSYTKAFDAAVDGLALYQKQNERDKKKAATPAPTPAPAAKATAHQSA